MTVEPFGVEPLGIAALNIVRQTHFKYGGPELLLESWKSFVPNVPSNASSFHREDPAAHHLLHTVDGFKSCMHSSRPPDRCKISQYLIIQTSKSIYFGKIPHLIDRVSRGPHDLHSVKIVQSHTRRSRLRDYELL